MNNFLLAPEKRKLRPSVNLGKAFDKMKQNDPLTPDEQKLFDALCRADVRGYYEDVILNMFKNYSVEKFRMLIMELLSQRDDNSHAVYQILGKDVYDCLLALKKKL